MKVLLLENIHPTAKEKLENEGFEVELLSYSPPPEQMPELFSKYDIIGIRSKTKLTKEILEQCSHLLGIGCFCIGTNQVDLEMAKKLGIAVFNAPHSNTRSVAELVIAEMVILARQLGDRNNLAHKGTWLKSAKGANEIRGKKLGIVGYGHIGSQVSVLAESFGLQVYFFDVTKKLPLGNAIALNSLEELLETCDFVTLHVPETAETKNMIGKKELNLMQKGSYLINASRGTVVVIEDLVEKLKQSHLGGCAIDVFPTEPASNEESFKSTLQELKNVFLTPHIGGSTEEAQFSIGNEVSESLSQFIKVGTTAGSVNFPQVDISFKPTKHRIVNIHKNVPGVLGKINGMISTQGANIEAQYLATDEQIGYLIIDVDGEHVDALSSEIKSLDQSILTRVIS
ncbi:MAG: phosphoglycerate dehydrogenase [Bacteriovoracaceae bacterium]|jgi:D-3-phosphoglycerate dehydrogenase|nr:phosphoglycerate dehydrogenase [Bacteriovoracaceae bacterium]